ncbi:DMT family transporter [Sciscionella sediminilitoris]|uniref:DMT family transporter n=1 Tax=Sciscionella sediminilitoris TaxID=1445613 RepID=UPI0004DFBED9|nr:multidrug efflux SMR transporter [Sciscionella sp. SE31]
MSRQSNTNTGSSWLVLLLSAVLEAVWATALGASDGFTEPVAVVIFALGLVLSMTGLGYAMRGIPISTAYAVWTGIGAALTVTYAMLTGEEAVSAVRLALLAGIVGSVIGLKLVKPPARRGTR